MKNLLQIILLIVSVVSIVEAGRYDKNRKLGIRTGRINMSKFSIENANENVRENGFTIRDAKMGYIKKYSDLPDIQEYDNTNIVQNERDIWEKMHYDFDMMLEYDERLSNITEFSREIYDTYLVNPEDSSYMMLNTSWVIVFTKKDDQFGIHMALKIHDDFDEYYKHGFRIGLVDPNLDPILEDTFDQQFPVQLFVLDNDTKKAYSWEFDRRPNETFDWVVNREYRKSAYQFKIPRVLYKKEHLLFQYWKLYRLMFKMKIGDPMEVFFMGLAMKYHRGIVLWTPLRFLLDWDGNDIFQFKLIRKMGLCAGIVLLIIFIIIQIIRELCCKTVRYVKPKRLIDKDD